ncbi:hypothetical protein M2145_002532 [Lachnospiraceae bacterium PF1-21]
MGLKKGKRIIKRLTYLINNNVSCKICFRNGQHVVANVREIREIGSQSVVYLDSLDTTTSGYCRICSIDKIIY